MDITREDYFKYPFHTDGAIKGIKTIQGMTSKDLQLVLSNSGAHEKLRMQLSDKTNPNWVTNQVAEELYDRDVITEAEFDAATQD